MIQGLETVERLELVISLTSIRSQPQIDALRRYFVGGVNISACAALSDLTESNLQRAIKRVQAVDDTIEHIKELDWARFKSPKKER